MKPARLLPLAFVVAVLLAVPGTAAAASCSGSLSQGFWTHITATHVSCTSAKT
jgi:threonine/homoserine/homoserine lactone efflux protein